MGIGFVKRIKTLNLDDPSLQVENHRKRKMINLINQASLKWIDRLMMSFKWAYILWIYLFHRPFQYLNHMDFFFI